MKLAHILASTLETELHGSGAVEITSLCCDSRLVRPGALFCALRGTVADGHRYIAEAVRDGAAALLLEDAAYAPAGVPWILAADSRSAMARMAASFYGDPTANVPLIGITGTNGKTTTTYLIEAILTAAGLPAAVLGTISYRFGATTIAASHTTPESIELQSAFRQLADAGARSFVMEVSSHALEQKRADGCHFDVGIFSNLTRDHLDYHGSMEQYQRAKERLFAELLRPDDGKPLRTAVINMDDSYGPQMAEKASCPVISYGIEYPGDVRPLDVAVTVSGISGTVTTPKGELFFTSRLLGRFNLSNILSAVAAGIALDLPLAAIKAGVEGHTTVPGRLERVDNSFGVTCLVDYAHTGDALYNVLSTLKEIATARIITVFGCGGDRDPGKRPIMGRIAAEMSDIAIVTSDNPRTEDPHAILSQIREGITPLGLRECSPDELQSGLLCSDKGFVVMENRRNAINLAVRVARQGDILLLAGKGHEDYQIIGKTRQHFDDREEAGAAFREKREGCLP